MLIENSLRRRTVDPPFMGAVSGGVMQSRFAEAIVISVFAACVVFVVTYMAADHLQDLAPSLPFPVRLKFPVDGAVLSIGILAAFLAAGFCGVWSGLEARSQAAA
jgi:uncharacterized membrane protein YfcA